MAVAVRVGFGAKVAVGARGLEVKTPGLGETLGEGVLAEAAVTVGGVVGVEARVSEGRGRLVAEADGGSVTVPAAALGVMPDLAGEVCPPAGFRATASRPRARDSCGEFPSARVR